MTETISRTDEDQIYFKYNVELTSILFTLQRFGSSPSYRPNDFIPICKFKYNNHFVCLSK